MRYSYLETCKSFDWFELKMKIIIGLIVTGIILVIAVALDSYCNRYLYRNSTGVLVGKFYKPSDSRNYTTYQNGKVGYATSYSPEEFKVHIKTDGEIKEVETDITTYYKYKEGSIVPVEIYKGKLFGLETLEIK